MTTSSPVPIRVADELTRVARRWQQLPVDHARRCLPEVFDTIAAIAGERVPDLGPAVVMDQLVVVTYDACRDAEADGDLMARADELHARLVNLRRALA